MTTNSRSRRISGLIEACNPFSRKRSASICATQGSPPPALTPISVPALSSFAKPLPATPVTVAAASLVTPSGSPAPSTSNSFRSNVAVVDGPASGAGFYYGVFLGEPPKNFGSSVSSAQGSIQGSPARSGHSGHSRSQSMQSMGTSAGSYPNQSTGTNANAVKDSSSRSKHSSIAFPTGSTTMAIQPVRPVQPIQPNRAIQPIQIIQGTHAIHAIQPIQAQPQVHQPRGQEVVSSHSRHSLAHPRPRHASFTAVPSAHASHFPHVSHITQHNQYASNVRESQQHTFATIKTQAQPQSQVPPHRSLIPSSAVSNEPQQPQQAQQQHLSKEQQAQLSQLPQSQSNMPPSVLKRRERRQTFSYSSSTSDELPTTSLRTACKFLIGSASECQKIQGNSPLFPRLKQMAQQLNRMYDCLGTIAHERDVISPGDSNELNGLLRDIQNLLIRSMQPRPFNPYRVQELDGYYHLLIGFVKRLEATLQVRSIQMKINALTFQHNVSQAETLKIHDQADRIKADTRTPRNPSSQHSQSRSGRDVIRDKRAELDRMHHERVAVREEIERLKAKLAAARQERDSYGNKKTVRFQQVA